MQKLFGGGSSSLFGPFRRGPLQPAQTLILLLRNLTTNGPELTLVDALPDDCEGLGQSLGGHSVRGRLDIESRVKFGATRRLPLEVLENRAYFSINSINILLSSAAARVGTSIPLFEGFTIFTTFKSTI